MGNNSEEYLVRGAMLACKCGSHPRRLNLPECHGVYALGKPVIDEWDCMVGKNINYFGVCLGGTPPVGAEEILLDAYVPEGEESTGVEVQGPRCAPCTIGIWKPVKRSTKISSQKAAVTMNSYLVCRWGGIIIPITSGQEFEE
ncbi:DUF4280 domain-containing protein [Anaerosporobacter sp.]|uniref:DUF4280 domain-containing protein n=1 Tax=Anaerosporobacter sp. TaxID=1872529 RepID=UPI00286F81B0|nr:DUF4280 domain-containing protein [Anaerosporobacter sp.]